MQEAETNKPRRDLGDWEGDRELARKAVAYLIGGGAGDAYKKQSQIATLMGLSPPTIHRLLDEGKGGRRPLFQREVRHLLSAEEVAAVRARLFPNPLGEALRLYCDQKEIAEIKSVDVVSGLSEPNFSQIPAELLEKKRGILRWAFRAQEFGEKVAPTIRDLVLSTRNLGVTSRYTMYWMLKGLQKLHARSPWSHGDTDIIPLWGHAHQYSPLGSSTGFDLSPEGIRLQQQLEEHSPWISHEQLSASSICSGLNELFNPKGKPTRSIDGFPGILPLSWGDKRINRFMEDLCELSPAYQEIFGSDFPSRSQLRSRPHSQIDGPLIEKIDGALVPVGTPLHPERFWSGDYMRQAGFTKKDWEVFCQSLHGDIGGVPLPKVAEVPDELRSACKKLIHKVSRSWLSVKKRHLQDCVTRSHNNDDLGVVVIACGSERARPILEGIKEGMINRLVVDEECASGIELEIRVDTTKVNNAGS